MLEGRSFASLRMTQMWARLDAALLLFYNVAFGRFPDSSIRGRT